MSQRDRRLLAALQRRRGPVEQVVVAVRALVAVVVEFLLRAVERVLSEP
ncbi:hypothetical protein M0R89_21495 (plasmid) [Halorussus limi]|uniref:Uncharacterized protein n=1 Tax=Halorussus limi TaxID=2938695 RepID=A0A8U0I0H2_9EURY|nr:hypothetical protein [Halorussus limi]UPV76770.1 hypothetical protein M0R89_21495 [Halorussus limi]